MSVPTGAPRMAHSGTKESKMTNETCNDRPAATAALSDEALAKIAYDETVRGRVGAEIGWIFRSGREQADWVRVARAVRAALESEHDVAPLAPGETVRIADQEGGWIEVTSDEDFPHLLYVTNDAWLDAAGVAALELACRRWRKAREGGE